MSDWSDDTIPSFLEAYQNEQCIWNTRDTNHKNRQKVNDAWTRLSVLMNKSIKELKTKKEILMATFRRHLKRKQDSIRSGAGADDTYKPIWFAYEVMESFLGPVYTCTKNINTEEEAPSQEIANETEAIEEEEDNNLGQASTSSHTPTPVTSRRRPATDSAERQMSAAFGQLTNILAKRQKEHPPPSKEDDDCELYAKLLAKKLRELPPDDRKLFMYDIDTLFINRIKGNLIRHPTLSSYNSVPYQLYSVPNASPISNRPSTSKTSYSEPNASPFSDRPSSFQSSYSEPLPNASPSSNQPSTSQTSHSEPLPIASPTLNEPPTAVNYTTPTIHIISNELFAPRTGHNIVNEALLKAYENFDHRQN
ncbi:unnamed protein product [Acanthoscelides obtectus]|uniref:MADF domain-containing protein n=2 Tax=Acanthoscelides obtectus TaxID=200917 RepID=A0A9P0L7N2_ACAOB|nr:unnamed protein product [Acanthoscelides obtectus]CAK1680843.1 hypothetical protein AOBTE_LOCUS32904 [Acanthoscelides obtectus]